MHKESPSTTKLTLKSDSMRSVYRLLAEVLRYSYLVQASTTRAQDFQHVICPKEYNILPE